MKAIWIGCIVISVGFITGCQGLTQSLATTAGTAAGHAAVPAAVSGLDELAKPDNQEKLERVTRSPAIQHTSVALGVGLGRGIIDEIITVFTKGEPQILAAQETVNTALGATRPTTSPVTVVSTTSPITATGPTTRPAAFRDPLADSPLSTFVNHQISPMATQFVASTFSEAMKSISSPQSQQQLSSLADAVGNAAMRGILRAADEQGGAILSRAFEHETSQFRPTFHELLAQELAPVARQIIDQSAIDILEVPIRSDISPAVVENARNLSHGGALGTHDGLIELGVLSKTGELASMPKALLWCAVLFGGVIGLSLPALVIVLLMIALSMRRQMPPTSAPA